MKQTVKPVRERLNKLVCRIVGCKRVSKFPNYGECLRCGDPAFSVGIKFNKIYIIEDSNL